MSKVETGIRALSADELELVSGGTKNDAFAGAKAGAEGWISPEGDDKSAGIGMVFLIALCVLSGL